jgi:phospholipid/cholesterol/gamma-HCH transport system ATP-binding protein
MHSLRVIGDRAAMIYEGRIIWAGDAGEIDRSGDPYVEQFVQGRADGPIKMPVRPL